MCKCCHLQYQRDILENATPAANCLLKWIRFDKISLKKAASQILLKVSPENPHLLGGTSPSGGGGPVFSLGGGPSILASKGRRPPPIRTYALNEAFWGPSLLKRVS